MDLRGRDGEFEEKEVNIRDRASQEARGCVEEVLTGLLHSVAAGEGVEDGVQGGLAVFTGRSGDEAEAVVPLSSGEDVADEVETELLLRLGEAGKGEAAPDARPGKVGEAELDLGGGGSGMRAL